MRQYSHCFGAEGVFVAASNPLVTGGVATRLGLLVLKSLFSSSSAILKHHSFNKIWIFSAEFVLVHLNQVKLGMCKKIKYKRITHLCIDCCIKCIYIYTHTFGFNMLIAEEHY